MHCANTLIQQAADYSRYFKRQLDARDWLGERVAASLENPLTRATMESFLAEAPVDDNTLGPRLRQLRAWVYAHVMVRDLAGLAPLSEVTSAMTLLAEVAIATAQRILTAQLAQRHGMPCDETGNPQDMVVVGMGKLGGGELNVSSDIDLIFLYPERSNGTAVDTDGARPVSAFDFHTKLGRLLIPALAENTDQGYVFRVDMRLRPNGESGPLAVSFDALENYFIAQGREWERYAWIKARPLTGGEHAQLETIVRPFVYRKYLDFGAINAMRSLHAQIRREVARREMADNIKLGPGGIREIEFIAQVFQLIRGGRDAGLQIRPTLQVLDALAARGLMPQETVQRLCDAYNFLRRLEHRLQYLDDAQTHMLPASSEDRAKIAQAMGFADYDALRAELDQHRAHVSVHFDEAFSDPSASSHELETVWSGSVDATITRERLESLKFRDPEQLAQRMQTFRQSSRYRAMSDDGRRRLTALAPRLLELCAQRHNPDETALRVLTLLEAICRRAAYLALLQQYPHTLARVVELASSSSWAADYLTRHPLLLDELLDSRELGEVTDWTKFTAELGMQLDQLGDDTERQMDVMREAHHAQVFRLLNQDLAGLLTVEKLSDHLSALADVMLAETLRQCWKKVPKKHAAEHRFIIVGYGKLGGKELGYASDLDIVFLYDDPDPEAQPIYSRLAQRINTWLSSHTPAGQLFETDLRLRPNGDSGLLVSSLEGFDEYERKSAWVWEHQALTRARHCAGHAKTGARFEQLRHELLCQPRNVSALRSDVLAMRKKMYSAHANKGEGFQLKHDLGGLIDVEFVIQYLVLAHASQWPELAANTGNIALLKLAGNVGLLPADVAHDAADAYRELRHAQHALRLNDQDSRTFDESLSQARKAVVRLWQSVFESLP
ncbi:MAG TPA: bifunctional [glutamate--ammonia ligase]-adenylyl-L-tyrosine phosphorylase/[glutamate--ammonia-ligase] adenylyltransferase [Rhodocyclaceae bacterium]|nr:bifunctional [glutamate--ammonia ligase]-adenylyl-L-tyrosine phosphorylase/[glutamate--ammonia-ligase] adenylyltransferase [Rhodocyclaceae bacterium]